MRTIDISKDFTEFPGPRYIKDGDYSGELFYKDFLEQTFDGKEELKIILDGTYGYPSSFLSEAFGPIYKNFGENGWNKINFVSEEDESLIEFILYLAKKYA